MILRSLWDTAHIEGVEKLLCALPTLQSAAGLDRYVFISDAYRRVDCPSRIAHDYHDSIVVGREIHRLGRLQGGWWAWAGQHMIPTDKHGRAKIIKREMSNKVKCLGRNQATLGPLEILLQRLEVVTAGGALEPRDILIREEYRSLGYALVERMMNHTVVPRSHLEGEQMSQLLRYCSLGMISHFRECVRLEIIHFTALSLAKFWQVDGIGWEKMHPCLSKEELAWRLPELISQLSIFQCATDAKRVTQALVPLLQALMPQMKPYFIRKLLWSLDKIMGQDQRQFQSMSSLFQCAGDRLLRTPSMSLSDAAVVSRAFSSVGLDHPPLFHRIARLVEARSDQLTPHDACDLAWAFASRHHAQRGARWGLGLRPAPLTDHHGETSDGQCRVSSPLLRDGHSILVNNSVYFEYRDHSARPWKRTRFFVKNIVAAMKGRLDELSPRQLALLSWSLGVLNFGHTSFMMEIGLEASQRPMPNYNAQENKWPFKAHDLATICWAMSANGCVGPGPLSIALRLLNSAGTPFLVDGLLQEDVREDGSRWLNPRHAVRVLTALGEMGYSIGDDHHTDIVCNGIAEILCTSVRRGDVHPLMAYDLLIALSRMGLHNAGLIRALTHQPLICSHPYRFTTLTTLTPDPSALVISPTKLRLLLRSVIDLSDASGISSLGTLPLARRLLQALLERLNSLPVAVADLSVASWAAAKLEAAGETDKSIWQALRAAASLTSTGMQQHSTASVVGSCSKWSPRMLADTFWALGHMVPSPMMGCQAPPSTDRLDHADEVNQALSTRGLDTRSANPEEDEASATRVAADALALGAQDELVWNCEARDLVDMLWGAARLSPSPALHSVLAGRAVSVLLHRGGTECGFSLDLSRHERTALLWSLASLPRPTGPLTRLMEQLADKLVLREDQSVCLLRPNTHYIQGGQRSLAVALGGERPFHSASTDTHHGPDRISPEDLLAIAWSLSRLPERQPLMERLRWEASHLYRQSLDEGQRDILSAIMLAHPPVDRPECLLHPHKFSFGKHHRYH